MPDYACGAASWLNAQRCCSLRSEGAALQDVDSGGEAVVFPPT